MLNTLITILIALILFHFFAIVPNFGQATELGAETTKIKFNLNEYRIVEKSKLKPELSAVTKIESKY